MRKVDIHGHAVIPLRAVTIATGGEISPLTIAFAVGDERRFLEDRRFCTRLNAYRLMPDGSPHPMPPSGVRGYDRHHRETDPIQGGLLETDRGVAGRAYSFFVKI